MIRYLVTGLLAGGVIVALLTAGGTTRDRADFVFINRGSIFTMDPASMSWMQDIRMALTVWEGLASYDPETTEPVPGCAMAPVVSADGREYTFTLRPEARWSNGDPVTAHDFVYAWRRATEPGTAADYAFFFEIIEGVTDYTAWRNAEIQRIAAMGDSEKPGAVREHLAQADRRFAERVAIRALDDKTLRVRLVRPVAYFLDLCAFSVFLPVHRASIEPFKVVGRDGQIYYDEQWAKPEHTQYNGPFAMRQWRFKRSVRLERNPYYWGREDVHLASVEAVEVEDPSTAWLMYDSGQVDWLSSVDADFAPDLLAISRSPVPGATNVDTPNATRDDIHVFPAFGTYFYNFNCTDRLPDGSTNPFKDPRVRQAFSMAVDRDQLVKHVTRRGELPATAFIPPRSIAGYPEVTGPGMNVARARTLLAEAGYPNGQGLPEVVILYNTGFSHDRIAEAIAAMWREHLGVKARGQGVEGKVFREDKKGVRFVICRASWFGDYGDPTTFLEMMETHNGNNDSGFSDPTYDAMLNAARREPDPDARLAILADAERYLVNDAMPILPLYNYVNIFAYDPDRIANLHLTPRLMTMLKVVEVAR